MAEGLEAEAKAWTDAAARPTGREGAASSPVPRASTRPLSLPLRAHEEGVVLLGSVLLFVWASRPAARWLIDDAGISFAYGMNLGLHGTLGTHLESWAVEGFSNPLTVGIVAVLSALRLFHPITTPGSLAIVLFGLQGLVAFRLLRDGLRGARWVPWLAVALFLMLEICTPATMIWYGSGLENGQLSLAIVVLLRRLQVGAAHGFSPRVDAACLVVCSLVRPEAPVFALAWLAVAALVVATTRDPASRPRADARRLLATLGYVACVALLLVALRYALFASLLPNTFYAKIGKVDVHRNYVDYVRPSLGPYWCAFGLPLSTVALFGSARLRALAMPLAAFLAAALALPFVAGSDWMGHHRFATSFLMLGHLSFAAACGGAWAEAARPAGWATVGRVASASLPAVFVALLFAGGRDEYRSFLHDRYVGFALIADQEGFVRLDVQRYLGLVYPVVALPDAGGSAVVGGMQLVDTAYLTDYHMARIREDPDLVTQYQLHERRVDLAEYHWWAFDKGLVGKSFLEVAHFDAERDYPNFFPVYAVRRDLVETADPGVDSVRVGDYGGIEAYLSGRTVAVGVPRAVLRVEVLVAARGTSLLKGCDIAVSVVGATEQREAFALSPASEAPVAPAAGRYYRQGFLLPLPDAPGDYPLSVRLCAAQGGPLLVAPRAVRVRAPGDLTTADVRDALGSAADRWEQARRIAQLREQLVAGLSPDARAALERSFRASYRSGSRTDVDAYDRLVADSQAGFLAPVPGPVRVVEQEVVDALSEGARRAESDGGAGAGARSLAVGRMVDDLRRSGFLGVARRRSWAGAIDEAVRDAAPDAKLDPEGAYARALGLALIFPEKAAYQKHLAGARLRGVSLLP